MNNPDLTYQQTDEVHAHTRFQNSLSSAKKPGKFLSRAAIVFAGSALIPSVAQADEPANSIGIKAAYNILENVPGIEAFYRRQIHGVYGLGLDLHGEFGNFKIENTQLINVKPLSGYAVHGTFCPADLDAEIIKGTLELGLCPFKVGGGFDVIGSGTVGQDQYGQQYAAIAAPTRWFGIIGAELGFTIKLPNNFGITAGVEGSMTTPTLEGYVPRGTQPYSVKEVTLNGGMSYGF